ncbi:MAG: TetR/AcrR family transcriptional regulator [Mycobacterium sp.]|nr:TetR/AcrR family transcriptional regulator [Mycobacterium sp.]
MSQRYRDARRRQITDAARRCFARTGFHGTTMQDVFVESGLSAGAVYGHFESKDELLSAIIEEVLSEIAAALDAVTDSTAPRVSLYEVMGEVFEVLDRPPNGRELARLAVQVWAEAARRPDLSIRLAGYYRLLNQRLTTLVQRYQHINAVDPHVDAHHLAQVLTALGPAFLSQRALLDDVTAETFTLGLRGLLEDGRSRVSLRTV